MHKIDLSTNNFRMRRFVVLQLVIALFVILFTYKWALGVTAVVDQNIIINIIYGFAGFIVLLILHELIHRVLFLVFKKIVSQCLISRKIECYFKQQTHVLTNGNFQL